MPSLKSPYLAIPLLILTMWLSSGMLSPYATSLDSPTVLPRCGYLANIDHETFLSTFRMLSGAPVDQWHWSVVLRRVLYPILAYPLMSAFGFLVGGFLTNIILHLAAFILLIRHIDQKIGKQGAVVVAWIFATYPGIAYWVGLPYSYAFIVPGTVFIYLILNIMESSVTLRRTLGCALGIGVLSTGYDFLPFFGLATVLLICRKKQWGALVPSLIALLAPSAIVASVLYLRYDLPFTNGNTASYTNILTSYLTIPAWEAYHPLLTSLPSIAWSNFLYGNFIALPLLAVIALLLLKPFGPGPRPWTPTDASIVLAIVIVFLFNNLAPPYSGWQLRGEWVARVYQPIFIFYLVLIARACTAIHSAPRLIYIAVVVTILAQSAIVFGPALRSPLMADYVYAQFYLHGRPGNLTNNLARYGRRPIGICKNGIGW